MRQWQIFNSETFHDHNGQPSFVRKSLAWVLLFGGGLIVLGVLMFGVSSLSVSKEIASFILKALAAITSVVGIAYGAMQGAKGYAQGQAAKAKGPHSETGHAPHRAPSHTTPPQNPPHSSGADSRARPPHPQPTQPRQKQTTQDTDSPLPKVTNATDAANSSREKQDQSSKEKPKEA